MVSMFADIVNSSLSSFGAPGNVPGAPMVIVYSLEMHKNGEIVLGHYDA